MRNAEQNLAPTDRVFSVIEAAELLSCSRMHIYRLIAAGELPVIDIAIPGSRLSKSRIRESDLHDFLSRAALQ